MQSAERIKTAIPAVITSHIILLATKLSFLFLALDTTGDVSYTIRTFQPIVCYTNNSNILNKNQNGLTLRGGHFEDECICINIHYISVIHHTWACRMELKILKSLMYFVISLWPNMVYTMYLIYHKLVHMFPVQLF